MRKPRTVSIDDELKAVLQPESSLLATGKAWLKRYQRPLWAALATLLLLLTVPYSFLYRHNRALRSYEEAKGRWEDNPSERSSLLPSLAKIAQKQPQWLRAWKGEFLQGCLNLQHPELVEPLREPTSLLSANLDEAAAVTLSMARGQWQEALKQIEVALAQSDLLPPKCPETCRLQLLAQKALAYQKLELKQQEKEGWIALLAQLSLTPEQLNQDSQARRLEQLEWLQAQGYIGLLEYIQDRLSTLAS